MPEWSRIVISTSVGGIIGFLAAVFAPIVRDWFTGPHIKIEFLDRPEYISFLQVRTPDGGFSDNDRCYLRLRVRNIRGGLAKQVRVFLAGVEFRRKGETHFQPTDCYDTVELPWSLRGEASDDALDLPRGLWRHFDVLTAGQGERRFRVTSKHSLIPPLTVGQQEGTYRFTIMVAGDNFSPKTMHFEVDWENWWCTFCVRAAGVIASVDPTRVPHPGPPTLPASG